MSSQKQHSLLDPFTQRRVIETTRKAHFDSERVHIEMAEEFGRRLRLAERDGLPIAVAFESCREHFKIVGQAMLDIANSLTIEMIKPGEEK